ncbi:cell adhesion molecule 1-like isoform X2 [Ruditapes philippinarum]|uniref:cell adhesion molecule 1-like isoform X2 n=1 Tax=Ruditapes philippinarum TaxID=129788 RepID=UPI00295B7DC5|nr:cell adhesion molecule 1-like isoform X2 [Ruditapes philippinarum]
MTVYEGEDARFFCIVTNDETAKIQWLRIERDETIGDRPQHTYLQGVDESPEILILHDVVPADAGQYMCLISNTYGSKYLYIYLTVLERTTTTTSTTTTTPTTTTTTTTTSTTSTTTTTTQPTASSTAQITLSDEDLQKYGNIISHNFQDQIKTIVTDAVESIVQKINNRLEFLENENKNLKSRVLDLEAKLIKANESQDKANQYRRY